MLITFRVSNFLSFNDEAELSMQAGPQRNLPSHYISTGSGRNDVNILKTAVIYGANASGKSNLIKAMDFAKKVIVNGIKSETTFNKHFRLDPANREKPSSFEFEFKLDEKMYAYGFSAHLESKKIKEEWLVELGKTSETVIYERKVLENGQSEFPVFNLKLSDKKAVNRFEVYREDVLDSQLFLTELITKTSSIEIDFFKKIFSYFWYSVILYPNTSMPLPKFYEDLYKGGVIELFKLFRIGIVDLSLDEREIDEMELNNHLLKTELFRDHTEIREYEGKKVMSKLVAKHLSSNGLIDFDLEEESDGTRRLLDLIFLLIALKTDINKEKIIIIIDEIDRSLHPELSRKFIEIFFEITEGTESQLIVSTHESSLLDLNLLRRDEIWFTEKDTNGATKLYSLEEFKPRHDTELRKAYLTGRFGAIPFISNIKSLGWLKDKPLETTPSV
jgi:uncharacterized protein